ncbi:MAG TPA: adenylate/guanylate cyclase domain-containing protein [Macromonas sp.]|nr:adenylate/guanylate cyclase domain-containing protein [Macromonas sp.]
MKLHHKAVSFAQTAIRKNEHRRLGYLLPLLMVLCGLILLVSDPLPLRMMRNLSFDQYQRWQPRAYEPAPVRIVDIDDASLSALGQWPWPRTRLAEMVNRLQAAGVASIAFDVVFAEPDRTSPKAVTQLWSLKGPQKQTLEQLPDHDAVFAHALELSPTILGSALKNDGKPAAPRTDEEEPARLLPYRLVYSGPSLNSKLHRFSSSVEPLPLLQSAAKGVGAVTFVPEGDGVIRYVPLLLDLNEQPVPTLASEALRVAVGEQNFLLRSEEEHLGLSSLRVGAFDIPTTPQGDLWLHYSRSVPERYVPAKDIFSDQIPVDKLQGHIVLVGSSAQGLMDLRFNPLGRIMPGVEAHAQALEQILTGHYLMRPGWATAVESLSLVLGTCLVGFAAVRMSALMAASLTLTALGSVLWGGWYAFSTQGLLLNSVTPALMILLTFVLGSLLHHYMSEREQRWIRAAFARYVSPNRVSHLVDHPEAMELGGRRQECSFVFTDLASFTTLLEAMDPGEAVALLNAYLDDMIGIAFKHEGTLDRIVGDAVAIMFSAPVPQADHKARALACALEMDTFATAYATELNQRNIPFGHTRIGVHSGEVIVGNFGGNAMFDYRALGDPVNTASRLESVNKQLGTRLCVSADTLAGCPDAVARHIGRLVLKGKTQELQVLEPLVGSTPPATYAPLTDYEQAYALMAQDLVLEAYSAFRSLFDRYPQDPLVKFHWQRLQNGDTGDVIRFTEK